MRRCPLPALVLALCLLLPGLAKPFSTKPSTTTRLSRTQLAAHRKPCWGRAGPVMPANVSPLFASISDEEPEKVVPTLRGGAAAFGGLGAALAKFSTWVGESKGRCWALLIFCILNEIVATTNLKIAKESGNIPRLIMALSMVDIRYAFEYMINYTVLTNNNNMPSNSTFASLTQHSLFYSVSFLFTIKSLLAFATSLAKIEVSIAYAVWSGLGTAIVTIVGLLLFGESCDLQKVVSLVAIIGGVLGLNLRSA